MRRYILLLIILFVVIVGALFESKRSSSRIEHSSHLFDPAFFNQAYDKGQQYKEVVNGQIFGGIIPHHVLAAPLIAGFFEGMANQKVTTVILLSPNQDRKSTRLNSSHSSISYAVFCLKQKK